MNKKRLRVAKKSPMFEKKVIFGIRKFTVGVASVGIATAFLISGTGQLVQAEEVATPSTEITAPINTDQTSDVDATASVAGSELVEEVVTSDTTATEASTLVAEAGEVFDAQVNTASVEEVVTSDTTAAEASTLVAEAGEAFDAQVNTASVENVATVAETATLSTPAEAPIEEGSIRLHFENVDETAPESQGLWTWGGVETPSDGNKWPTDTVNFSSSQVDDYGHYVDIKKSETPGTIGYVVLKDGEKITESDQKVELLVPEQNEAW
ncbi:MAG: pullulanase-associated domain-containing protein, partial [Streptococcus suis]